jgi:hypothetical protein
MPPKGGGRKGFLKSASKRPTIDELPAQDVPTEALSMREENAPEEHPPEKVDVAAHDIENVATGEQAGEESRGQVLQRHKRVGTQMHAS